jgi:CDP-diacylglycerol--glycerol-3-phosphate 3-phosphatidyltransferase
VKDRAKQLGRRLLAPLVAGLHALGVGPTAVTVAALPLSLLAAWLFATGRLVPGGIAMALAGLCDSIDGELSRRSGKASRLGAFVDSTVDRFGEAAALTGVAWYYMSREPWFALLATGAMVLSLLVSYVRARAEGLGIDCGVGLFERPVRVLVLLAGVFIGLGRYLPVALGLVALGSCYTVIERVVHVVKQARDT